MRDIDEFGFTNNQAHYDAVIKFRDDAVRDGWSCVPTYDNHESMERAASLEKEGFKCHILSRTKVGKWRFAAQVSLWGPDGLCITAPMEYDWEKIKSGIKRCVYCGKEDVTDIVCVGFAGRSCPECAPAENKKLGPNWWR